jgi:hypothetical protein
MNKINPEQVPSTIEVGTSFDLADARKGKGKKGKAGPNSHPKKGNTGHSEGVDLKTASNPYNHPKGMDMNAAKPSGAKSAPKLKGK